MEREEGHRETTVAERWVQVCCSYTSVGQNPGPVQPGVSMNHFLPILNFIRMIFTGAKTDQVQLHVSGLCSGKLAALFFPSSSCFPQSIWRRFHSAHPTLVTTGSVRSLASSQ